MSLFNKNQRGNFIIQNFLKTCKEHKFLHHEDEQDTEIQKLKKIKDKKSINQRTQKLYMN